MCHLIGQIFITALKSSKLFLKIIHIFNFYSFRLVVGLAMKNSFNLQLIHNNYTHTQEIYRMMELSQQPHVKPWERKHAEATKLLSEGYCCCFSWKLLFAKMIFATPAYIIMYFISSSWVDFWYHLINNGVLNNVDIHQTCLI